MAWYAAGGCSSQLLRDQWVPHLEQARTQVPEWRIEADLHAGRHEQLIGELRNVVARHPLHEHFHAQLMFALARSGRQAEALLAYREARAALVGELGVEPGPELRLLHGRILAGDAALVTPPPTSSEPVVPRELPGAVREFTGRESELAALTALTEQATGAVVISAIGGTAGEGNPKPEANTLDRYRTVTHADPGTGCVSMPTAPGLS